MSASFLRFWAGSTISAAGSALTAFAIPIIAVQHLGATPGQMGLLFAAGSTASLLTRLPAATWADRSRSPLRVVARGQLVSGVLIAVLPALSLLTLLTYEALVAVVAAVAVAAAIIDAFAAPSLPRLIPRSELASAFGRFSAARGGAHVAAPAIGGVLLQILAAPALLLLDALSFFVAAILVRSIRFAVQDQPREDERSANPADLWAIFRVPFLRRCVLVVLYASLANGATSALLVLFMLRQLELAPSAVGLVLGAGAVGGVMAGLVIGVVHARLGVARTAAVGGLLMIASLAPLPLAEPGWSALAACLFYELAGSFGAALMVITIVSEIPVRIGSAATARAMAIANLVPELAASIGALAGGVLASVTSTRSALWASLVIALAAGLLSLLAWRARAAQVAHDGRVPHGSARR